MTHRPFLPLIFFAGALAWAAGGCGAVGDPLSVGSVAPEFKVSPILGSTQPVSLSNYKGHVVIVDFWATWCGPCREMLPHLQQLWESNKDKGLQVFAISTESADKVAAFQSESKFDFPCYTDESKEVNSAYGITGYPTTLVIGKDGKVVYSTIGMDANTPGEIDAAVESALK